MVDYKEHVLFAGLFLFVAGMCGTQFYFLDGKIAAFRSEMRADFALIRADNAAFRSEILKTQSYLTKMLMKHDGEIAKLSERSVVKSPTKMLMKFNGEIAEPNEAQT